MAVRNPTIDGMRALAASSVVLLHVSAMQIARGAPDLATRLVNGVTPWGMPFFLPVSGYFQGRSERARSAPSAWRWERVRRIGLPYAFWSLAYMAFRVWVNARAGHGLPHWDLFGLLFAGDANSSLWFLPAVLYSGLLLSFFPSRRAATIVASIALPTAVTVIVAGAYVPVLPFLYRLPLAMSAYCVGYIAGISPLPEPVSRPRHGLVAAAVALAAVCGTAIAAIPSLGGGPTVSVVVGLAATLGFWSVGLLAFQWARGAPVDAAVARLAPLSAVALGVYASHTLLIEIVSVAMPPRSLPPLAWVGVAYVIVLGAAFGLALVMARIPGARRLVT